MFIVRVIRAHAKSYSMVVGQVALVCNSQHHGPDILPGARQVIVWEPDPAVEGDGSESLLPGWVDATVPTNVIVRRAVPVPVVLVL